MVTTSRAAPETLETGIEASPFASRMTPADTSVSAGGSATVVGVCVGAAPVPVVSVVDPAGATTVVVAVVVCGTVEVVVVAAVVVVVPPSGSEIVGTETGSVGTDTGSVGTVTVGRRPSALPEAAYAATAQPAAAVVASAKAARNVRRGAGLRLNIVD